MYICIKLILLLVLKEEKYSNHNYSYIFTKHPQVNLCLEMIQFKKFILLVLNLKKIKFKSSFFFLIYFTILLKIIF